MKYARDRKITSSHTAEVLIEAFPWIKNATGKTILIKYGGAAMVDPELRNAVMSDIVMLKIMGVNPVIVHGGGAAINKNMDKFGIDVEFKDGQRVTSDEAMDVVKMTLVGKVNEELVLAMNEHGNPGCRRKRNRRRNHHRRAAQPRAGPCGHGHRSKPRLHQCAHRF